MDVSHLTQREWFAELLCDVQQELEKQSQDLPDRSRALEQEREDLRQRITGWKISLGNPQLSSSVRAEVEADLATALAREQEITHLLVEMSSRKEYAAAILDPQLVVDRLNRLDEVLAAGSPTLMNLELSLHISSIDCYPDGKVILSTCRLGALAEGANLLRREDNQPGDVPAESEEPDVKKAKPRRRAKLRVDSLASQDDDVENAAHFAADPERFAGLPEHWFWEDVFQVPRRMSWAEAHALEVAEYRLQHRLSIEKTAAHFGKTPPTIKQSLKFAKEKGVDATGAPLKLPRGRRFAVRNAEAVAAYVAKFNATIKAAAEYFKVSEPTISKALRIARGELPIGNGKSQE